MLANSIGRSRDSEDCREALRPVGNGMGNLDQEFAFFDVGILPISRGISTWVFCEAIEGSRDAHPRYALRARVICNVLNIVAVWVFCQAIEGCRDAHPKAKLQFLRGHC